MGAFTLVEVHEEGSSKWLYPSRIILSLIVVNMSCYYSSVKGKVYIVRPEEGRLAMVHSIFIYVKGFCSTCYACEVSY